MILPTKGMLGRHVHVCCRCCTLLCVCQCELFASSHTCTPPTFIYTPTLRHYKALHGIVHVHVLVFFPFTFCVDILVVVIFPSLMPMQVKLISNLATGLEWSMMSQWGRTMEGMDFNVWLMHVIVVHSPFVSMLQCSREEILRVSSKVRRFCQGQECKRRRLSWGELQWWWNVASWLHVCWDVTRCCIATCACMYCPVPSCVCMYVHV